MEGGPPAPIVQCQGLARGAPELLHATLPNCPATRLHPTTARNKPGTAEEMLANDGTAEEMLANDGTAEEMLANDGTAEDSWLKMGQLKTGWLKMR